MSWGMPPVPTPPHKLVQLCHPVLFIPLETADFCCWKRTPQTAFLLSQRRHKTAQGQKVSGFPGLFPKLLAETAPNTPKWLFSSGKISCLLSGCKIFCSVNDFSLRSLLDCFPMGPVLQQSSDCANMACILLLIDEVTV